MVQGYTQTNSRGKSGWSSVGGYKFPGCPPSLSSGSSSSGSPLRILVEIRMSRDTCTATEFKLPQFETPGREVGGVMLNITGMNLMEKSMLLDELFALRKADKAERDQLLSKFDRMSEQLLSLNENSQAQAKVIAGLKQMITDLQKRNQLLQKENAALKEQKGLSAKYRFGSKSQKVSSGKNVPDSRESDKEDFDGSSTPGLPLEEEGTNPPSSVTEKEKRPYRQGMSYKWMQTDRSVCHDFDFSRLPKEAVIIKTFYKYSYQQVSYILEHKYQVVHYKLPGGKIRESYFSKDGSPDSMDVVPGTHASADFLAHARIRSFLNYLTSAGHPPRGELMEKAVNYLNNFWDQIFAYLKDGRYSIDNSIAERFNRPLAGERKDSLFFGSNRMAHVSVAYHTLISTCRANGIAALSYLKKFFREVVNGRRDYENLLPMTIGIGTNKL